MIYLLNYAGALRCIGQALEPRGIDLFELTASKDDAFLVEYGDPDPPHTAVLKLQFSSDSIKILDREGQAKRRHAKAEFRFDSLPEMLRATGRYIDSKRVRLLRLTNCFLSEGGEVDLKYETRSGEVRSETLLTSSIREIGVTMYQRRSNISNPINLVTRRS